MWQNLPFCHIFEAFLAFLEKLNFTQMFVISKKMGRKEHKFSEYRKAASSNTSCLETHTGFFRLLMKRIFDPYELWPFDKKLIS